MQSQNFFFKVILILSMLSFSYTSALTVEEFEVEAFDYSKTRFTIPGKIFFHEETSQERPTLFLCHGGPNGSIEGDEGDFGDLSSVAENLGCNIVAFDYRGSSIDAGVYKTVAQRYYTDEALRSRFFSSVHADYGIGPLEDLRVVLEYVKNNYRDKIDFGRLFIGGYSYGGYMTVLAALDLELQKEFRGMISISAFYNLGEYEDINCPILSGDDPEIVGRKAIARKPLNHAANIVKPFLLIHGGIEDRTTLVNREDAEKFLDNIRRAGKEPLLTSYFMESMAHVLTEEHGSEILAIIRRFMASVEEGI